MATEERQKEIQPLLVEKQLWKVMAGNNVYIPKVGSIVCYFPDGHAEHSIPFTDLSDIQTRRDWSLCKVSDVKLCVNRQSDEVYYKSVLVPLPFGASSTVSDSHGMEEVEEEAEMKSFTKIVTQSDASNGGGFSVPKFCADSIFPRLDFRISRPDQILSIRDLQGTTWTYRHIYRGTPRRHLLTTGWGAYVTAKKLVAGDSVVFAKNKVNEFFVGVRRGNNSARMVSEHKVTLESVREAVRKEDTDQPFEVTFYPRGATEFVVSAKVVEESLKIRWIPGIRVRIARLSDDFAKTSWYQGTVSYVRDESHVPLQSMPWKSIKVEWDDPELKCIAYVNPWQVEVIPAPVSSANNMLFSLPHLTNINYPQHQNLEIDRQGNLHLLIPNGQSSMLVLSSGSRPSVEGAANFPLLNSSISPVGMQGARQSVVSVLPDNTENMLRVSEKIPVDNPLTTTKHVAKELNNSNNPLESESLSTESLTSVLSTSVGPKTDKSFMLFGQRIDMQQPTASCKKCVDACYCSY